MEWLSLFLGTARQMLSSLEMAAIAFDQVSSDSRRNGLLESKTSHRMRSFGEFQELKAIERMTLL
jgi:hypothetical protein